MVAALGDAMREQSALDFGIPTTGIAEAVFARALSSSTDQRKAAAGLSAGTLAAAPTDKDTLTTIRRSYHTLKGSGRMVGLASFGEAAWAMERVLNAWLAEQKPMQPGLLHLWN